MSVGESSTPLGRVRGLGSAREGGEPWLTERVTSIALLLLGAVPMALLILVGFKHALDGMKVVVDDYVHDEGNRFALNLVLLFLAAGGGALALFALARIAFGGAA